ncbi:MAG: class I SAM-dependent methyltransferase [Anaerolineales bacterium]
MRLGDRMLQKWRIRIAAPWILMGSRVLDIGCHNGEFLQFLGARIVDSIGVDPLAPSIESENFTLIRDTFQPATEFASDSFDAISLLATLEHIKDTRAIAFECARILRPAGRVVITIPSPLVDEIIDILIRFRVLDGMSLEEHHGLHPSQLPDTFQNASFTLLVRRRFQLGLNNLLVFENQGSSI